jgi:hypothetical protein
MAYKKIKKYTKGGVSLSSLFVIFFLINLFVFAQIDSDKLDNQVFDCFSLSDFDEVVPVGNDIQVYEQIKSLVESEANPFQSLALIQKVEQMLPKISSPAFRGQIAMVLINHYIGLNENEAAEKLILDELNKKDVDVTTVLRATSTYLVARPEKISKSLELIEFVLKRSDLTQKHRLYFEGRYMLLHDIDKRVVLLEDMKKKYPNLNQCLAFFYEQAALMNSDKNPNLAYDIMMTIPEFYPAYFQDNVLALRNFIFLAEQANKLDISLNLAIDYVKAHPKSEDSFYLIFKIAEIYFNQGMYQQSMDYYQQVINFPIVNIPENESLRETAKTNYSVAHARDVKGNFIPYDDIKPISKSNWPWTRIVFMASGVILILIGFTRLIVSHFRKQ